MRVALTHAFCWPEVRRGGERLVAELSAAMATLGHDVTVFSSAFSPGRSVSDGMRWVRLRRSSVDTCRAEADFGRRVLPALLAGRFDVVHAFGRRDGVASLRAAKVHPSRLTAYTDIGVPERAWWEARGREADYVARVVRDVDLYGCMSRYALDFLERDYGRVGVLTPGGVDLDAFAPGPPRTRHPTILFSGAVDQPHKGVGTLVDALPLVARAFPDVRLVLSGPGDPAPVLVAASAPALDRIDLVGTGELAEQRDRYASAWCCALPSWGDT